MTEFCSLSGPTECRGAGFYGQHHSWSRVWCTIQHRLSSELITVSVDDCAALLLDALFQLHLSFVFSIMHRSLFWLCTFDFFSPPMLSMDCLPSLAGCSAVWRLCVTLSGVWDVFVFSSALGHVFGCSGYLSQSPSLYSFGAWPSLYLSYAFKCTPFLIAQCIRCVSLVHTVSVQGTEIATMFCLPSQRPGNTKSFLPSAELVRFCLP